MAKARNHKRENVVKNICVLFMTFAVLTTTACIGNRGYKVVSSYKNVQREFSVKAEPGVYFPDLSALNFDESTMEYVIWPHIDEDGTRTVTQYVISGHSYIGGADVQCSFGCYKGKSNTMHIKDPFIYNGTELLIADQEFTNIYSFACSAEKKGYEYTVEVLYDEGKVLSKDDREGLRNQIHTIVLSFIQGIIDEA